MDAVAGWLREWGCDAVAWDSFGLFRPGDYILARLLELSEAVDAAIIIFSDEDKKWYRKEAQPQPRDNVLIEYGIFASRLGRERTIVCRKGFPKTASDLGGLVFVQFKQLPDDKAKKRLRDWVANLPPLISKAREREHDLRKTENAALPSGVDVRFTLPSDPKRTIAIITGSLRDVRDIDVIVSSENTDLQPARYYDRSMSGTLRYLDAEKKSDLRVRRDAYLESMEAAKHREDVRLPVLVGAVLPASTTGLKAQGVKYVFHAALVEGYVDDGYSAKEEAIQPGIERCFELFSELGKRKRLESMLFPVFGGGTGGLGPDQIAKHMIPAIQKGMERHPKVKRLALFARVEAHRRALHAAAVAAGWKGRR
jgi:O-acetyl-ADP-ribose deacetylase (regulator of RNase III)